MAARSIRRQHGLKVQVPVSLTFLHLLSQHCVEGEVELLSPSVRGRLVRAGAYLSDPQRSTKFFKGCAFEVGTLVGEYPGRGAHKTDHLIHQNLRHSHRLLVPHRIGKSKFAKVIHDRQNVNVTVRTFWMKTSYIYTECFKRSTG